MRHDTGDSRLGAGVDDDFGTTRQRGPDVCANPANIRRAIDEQRNDTTF